MASAVLDYVAYSAVCMSCGRHMRAGEARYTEGAPGPLEARRTVCQHCHTAPPLALCGAVGPEGGACVRQFPEAHAEHASEDGEMWTT